MLLVFCCLVPSVSRTRVDVEHALFTEVLGEHVADGAVDYEAIKKDRRFEEYLGSLHKVTPSLIEDDNERHKSVSS
jgi:hypothetical protein